MTQSADRSGGKKRISAVQTTIDVITVLEEQGPIGVTEIAREVGVSKGTAYNHLATLGDNELVVKDDDDRYHLALRVVDVAHHAKSRVPILGLVTPEVAKLAEKSGEAAQFIVEEHGVGVCLDIAHSENAVKTPVHVGSRVGLHHTAAGKAILAHLPLERVEEIVERRGLPAKTDDTITETGALLDQLERISKRGIAFDHGETIPGLVGVSAPITGQDGTVRGALSIVGPASRLDEDMIHRELPDMLMRSVNIVEVNSTTL